MSVLCSLRDVCLLVILLLLQVSTAGRYPANAPRGRTSSGSHDGVVGNREQDGMMGRAYTVAWNLWLTVNGEQWQRQASDLAVTVLGVCLCAFWTTLLYHLL